MKFKISSVIFYFFIFALFLPSMTLEGGIKIGNFKSRSCSDPDMVPVLRGNVSKTITTTRLLTCAGSCNLNQQCKYAIFDSFDKSCKHITDISNVMKPVEINDKCTVLSKTVDDNKTPDVKEECDERNKILYQTSDVKTIAPVTVSYSGNENFYMSSHDRFPICFDEQLFCNPAGHEFKLFIESGQEQSVVTVVVGLKGDVLSNVTDTTTSFNLLTTDSLTSTCVYIDGNSSDAVRSALFKGYRRVYSHYQTRAQIDIVSFDISVFAVNSLQDMKHPLYYTWIKESVTDGLSYRFSNPINTVTTLNTYHTETLPRLLFDIAWTKLEHMDNSETILEALNRSVLEGKEVRLLIEDTVSSDISSVVVTPGDVITSLTTYVSPVEARLYMDTQDRRIRRPVVGAATRYLEECVIKSKSVTYIKRQTVESLTWFVGSRNWTKLFEINSDKTVISGDHGQLYKAAIQGKDIRVCTVGIESVCHGASSINFKGGKIILTSPMYNGAEVGKDNTFQGVDCKQKYRLISTEGWVASVTFQHRSKTKSVLEANRTQVWFVEDTEQLSK